MSLLIELQVCSCWYEKLVMNSYRVFHNQLSNQINLYVTDVSINQTAKANLCLFLNGAVVESDIHVWDVVVHNNIITTVSPTWQDHVANFAVSVSCIVLDL